MSGTAERRPAGKGRCTSSSNRFGKNPGTKHDIWLPGFPSPHCTEGEMIRFLVNEPIRIQWVLLVRDGDTDNKATQHTSLFVM